MFDQEMFEGSVMQFYMNEKNGSKVITGAHTVLSYGPLEQ